MIISNKILRESRVVKMIILFLSYDTILKIDPEDFLFWDKVNLLQSLNRLDEAIEWLFLYNYIFLSYEKALQLDPYSSQLLEEKANLLK